MTIYAIEKQSLNALEPITFAKASLRERQDLQKMLQQKVDIIAPDTLVLAEEFGSWQESHRRIDLLAIDKEANLVVIELKRTEDGGHMELQAIRYAAMVSKLTFADAVATLADHLKKIGSVEDAQAKLVEFLGWDDGVDEEKFAPNVRIVLASAEFSKEITSAVLWLNEHDLDIRCVRLSPYRDGERILIDVQQVLPLPEAQDYQILIRRKNLVERASKSQERDNSRYDLTLADSHLDNLSRPRLIYESIKFICKSGVEPEAVAKLVTWRGNVIIAVSGTLNSTEFETARAELLSTQGKKPDTDRYFIGSEELIHANGQTYAVSKKWGIRALEAIEIFSQAFPNLRISLKAQPSEHLTKRESDE